MSQVQGQSVKSKKKKKQKKEKLVVFATKSFFCFQYQTESGGTVLERDTTDLNEHWVCQFTAGRSVILIQVFNLIACSARNFLTQEETATNQRFKRDYVNASSFCLFVSQYQSWEVK